MSGVAPRSWDFTPRRARNPGKGGDGHPRPPRRFHLGGSIEDKHGEATEKAAADSEVRATSGGKESRGAPSETAALQEGAESQGCLTQRWGARHTVGGMEYPFPCEAFPGPPSTPGQGNSGSGEALSTSGSTHSSHVIVVGSLAVSPSL